MLAAAIHTGVLRATVLDVFESAGHRHAILDVSFRALSVDGTSLDETAVDDQFPYLSFLPLPQLETSLEVDVQATARDYGLNSAMSAVHLPAPTEPMRATSSRLMAAPCSWTR